jgi:hypothetical protein
MSSSVEQFRARYRADVHPLYNGYAHLAFVLAAGGATIGWLLSAMPAPTPMEWCVVPCVLVVYSFAEYAWHRYVGHRRWRWVPQFFQRHNEDHHRFFLEDAMTCDRQRDWRVLLFPPYLIVAVVSIVALPGRWLLGQLISPTSGDLWALCIVALYLLYEFCHFSYHLPRSHWLLKAPWLKQMAALHQLHHRRSLMGWHNLNIVLPVADWALGTLLTKQRSEE